MQIHAMKRLCYFDTNGKSVFASRILGGRQLDDCCNWNGVTCEKGNVYTLHYYNDPVLKFDFDWFPSTVWRIVFQSLDLRRGLETRKLPRDLIFCSMDLCNLHGSIELRTLPARLESLFLNANNFSGAVFVAELPKKITDIRLTKNLITAVYVVNRNLPNSLNFALVNNRKKNLEITCLDDTVEDPRVQVGTSPDYSRVFSRS